MFKLGYNTNGFAHHRLEDAVAIIAEIGYRGVAITLERDLLDPPDSRGVAAAVKRLMSILHGRDLSVTIETGSRFILDPWRKHQPTLISRDSAARQRRLEFLFAAGEIAAAVGAESVSLWSGGADDSAVEAELMDRLCGELHTLSVRAGLANVRLTLEPEPGMFIDGMAAFGKLCEMMRHPALGLTLDVGHVMCVDEGKLDYHVLRWRDVLWNVHIEDMRRGVHDHLMFSEGDIDFSEVFAALRAIDYQGPVNVELSRHSHDAVEAARQAFEFLKRFD